MHWFVCKELNKKENSKNFLLCGVIFAEDWPYSRYKTRIFKCMSQVACYVLYMCRSMYRLKKQQHSFLVKERKWQDYRDQRSNQSPAVRGERRRRVDGKPYRKVLLHTAYRTLRCEGGKRQQSIFQSHSWADPLLHLCYLGVCVFLWVMVSSS